MTSPDSNQDNGVDVQLTDFERGELARKDWLLLELIEIVEVARGSLVLPVTLTVGGLQISGGLTTGRRYFDALAAQIQGAGGNAGASLLATLATQVDNLGKEAYGRVDGAPEADEVKPRPNVLQRTFVHLQDARVFVSGSTVQGGTGTMWRGKIASVDGLFFGQTM
ncbi:hypothetical protein [Aquincola tertiaricarbonis]|uniref:hypothetical protein n=1 Tax=Aquincola tertiaricarbonis TaxID=391953 RepID=UPI0012EDEB94|nr:hypothetical protein [Aquincola tertiaricarbonis]